MTPVSIASYVPLLLAWLAFGVVHSLTAASCFKQMITASQLVSARYYRLIYNGLALVSFAPVLLTLYVAPVDFMGGWSGSTWVGGLLVITGVGVAWLALRGYDLTEFVGWPPIPAADAGTLQQIGLLSYVRHPLYVGIIILLIGLFVGQPTWAMLLTGLAGFAYIRIGIYFEERKLIRVFGDTYLAYKRRVPMLIPGFTRHEEMK